MAGGWRTFGREMRTDRAWRVVVASAIGYGFGLNVLPYYTLGAFVGPLEASFGWSRAQIQASLGFMVAATLVGGWGVGWVTDRYGARRTAAFSQVGLATGLALLGLCPPDLWLWYALWFAMSLVALGTTPITWTRAIAGWFDKARGSALALALCGSSLSAAIVPLLAFLMQDIIDWREAYFLLAGIVLFIGLPCTIWLMPKAATRTSDACAVLLAVDQPGLTVREAVRGYRFWLLTLCLFLLGFAISGIIPNLVPMMVGQGFTTTAATSLVGLLGLAVVCGRLVTGFALDRYWAPWVACALLPLPAMSCIILAIGPGSYPMAALAVVFLGLSTGAEFDIAPYLVTRYFGLKRYSQIFALQWMFFTVAGGFAPAIFGYNYDVTGNYQLPLYFGCACFLAAPLLLLMLGRYPVFQHLNEGDLQTF